MLAGGGLVTGAAAVLVSGYYITDCMIHARGRGACDDAIEAHAFPLLAGSAAVIGTAGGFFSLNTLLDRNDAPPVVPPRGLVADVAPSLPPPPADPPSDSAASEDPRLLYPVARILLAQGMTQKEVEAELGLSRYHVRQAMRDRGDG